MLSYVIPANEDKPNPFRASHLPPLDDEGQPAPHAEGLLPPAPSVEGQTLAQTPGTEEQDPLDNVKDVLCSGDNNTEESAKECDSNSAAGSGCDERVAKVSKHIVMSGAVMSDDERSPVSVSRSLVSDSLTTPGSEDRVITKYGRPPLKR